MTTDNDKAKIAAITTALDTLWRKPEGHAKHVLFHWFSCVEDCDVLRVAQALLADVLEPRCAPVGMVTAWS